MFLLTAANATAFGHVCGTMAGDNLGSAHSVIALFAFGYAKYKKPM